MKLRVIALSLLSGFDAVQKRMGLSMLPAEEPNFLVLIPFDPREAMTLKQAADRAGKSETTVRNWCLNRGIGRRVAGGVWHVSKPAFEMLLDGNFAALSKYHRGMFEDPMVRHYFKRTNTPLRSTMSSALILSDYS